MPAHVHVRLCNGMVSQVGLSYKSVNMGCTAMVLLVILLTTTHGTSEQGRALERFTA